MPSSSFSSSFPAWPTNGSPCLSSWKPGRLADEHQVGVRVAAAEHDLRAALREAAARARRPTPCARTRARRVLDRNRAHGRQSTPTGGWRRSSPSTCRAAPRPSSRRPPHGRGRRGRPANPARHRRRSRSRRVIVSPSSRSQLDTEPTVTTPLAAAASSSITSEFWRRERRIVMRRSSRPCSFFAAWYSKFSDRSPCARATAIASTIALRRGPRARPALPRAGRAGRASAARRLSATPSGRSRRSRRSSRRRHRRRATDAASRPRAPRTTRTARDVRRRAVRAGDRLLAADELLEVRLALHADVFVDRHARSLPGGGAGGGRRRPRRAAPPRRPADPPRAPSG